MTFRSYPLAALMLCLALCVVSCSGPEPAVSAFRNPKMPLERRVSELMRRMRPDEKLALLRGVASLSFQAGSTPAGSIPENARLGIPAMRAVSGEMGVSAKDASGHPILATAFPANIGMAATWSPNLSEQAGAAIARQARALGRGQILGPLAEISRSVRSGNVFESFGEDPYLASRIVCAFTEGVQGEGSIATAIYPAGSPEQRVSREFDLRPLEAAVTEAGVWAVMPRASPASSSSERGFLRSKLGFRGFSVTAPPDGDSSAAAEAAIDDQVRGVLRAMLASGVFDRDTKTSAEIETSSHRALARAAAARSIVLLKNALLKKALLANENNLLPLDRNQLHSIAVLGPNAAVNRMAGGSFTVGARYSATPLDALREVFGSRVRTGATSPADAANMARNTDAAIVFAGTGAGTETETLDRTSLDLPAGQNELIEAVAKANPHTIVVLTTGSPVAMSRWIGDVPAVLEAWFPGEEGGHAIADVLTGAINPSGRLPVTFPARMEDLPAGDPGLYPGYRHFDRRAIQPLFPFGFGLSYTQFEYTDLAVMPEQVSPGQFAEVSLTLRNTGSRAGTETVQLYLHAASSATSVERAVQDLRAFQQVDLNPGESKRVRFTLTTGATAYFDEKRQDWMQDQAVFEVRVGSSSRDIRVRGTLSVTE